MGQNAKRPCAAKARSGGVEWKTGPKKGPQPCPAVHATLVGARAGGKRKLQDQDSWLNDKAQAMQHLHVHRRLGLPPGQILNRLQNPGATGCRTKPGRWLQPAPMSGTDGSAKQANVEAVQKTRLIQHDTQPPRNNPCLPTNPPQTPCDRAADTALPAQTCCPRQRGTHTGARPAEPCLLLSRPSSVPNPPQPPCDRAADTALLCSIVLLLCVDGARH